MERCLLSKQKQHQVEELKAEVNSLEKQLEAKLQFREFFLVLSDVSVAGFGDLKSEFTRVSSALAEVQAKCSELFAKNNAVKALIAEKVKYAR